MCKESLSLLLEETSQTGLEDYSDRIKQLENIRVRSIAMKTEQAIDIYKSRTKFLKEKNSPVKGVENLMQKLSGTLHKKIALHYLSQQNLNFIVFTDSDITQIFGVLKFS